MADQRYCDLDDLPLFPCRDGQLLSLETKETLCSTKFEGEIYISTETEFTLFGGRGQGFLDLSVCRMTLSGQIKRDIDEISSDVNLRRFRLDSFKLYARDHGLYKDHSNGMEIDMTGNVDFTWINLVWKWLDSYGGTGNIATALDGLYLIPLQDRKKLRKVYLTFSHF